MAEFISMLLAAMRADTLRLSRAIEELRGELENVR